MESEELGELRGLTKDEERLIYICNYYSSRILSLKECREIIDVAMVWSPIKHAQEDGL